MKLLVTGGRSYDRLDVVVVRLNQLHAAVPITELIHGDATGADAFAKAWAESLGITCHPEPVPPEQWQRLGGRAGNARNSLMLRKWKPDVVVAFPGGTGTLDMVKKARAEKIPTLMSWAESWEQGLEDFRVMTAHKTT